MRSTLLIGLAVVLVLILALIAWGVSANNGLVALQENVHSAWGQVETVLQRRYDLIPNLVNTVKGYAKHERDVLEDVTRLRSQWASAGTTAEKVKASGELEAGLARLLLVAERYPDFEGQREFPRSAIRVVGHGEPHHGRAATLQRRRPRLQHPRPPVPDEHNCRDARIRRQLGVLRGRPRSEEGPQGRFWRRKALTRRSGKEIADRENHPYITVLRLKTGQLSKVLAVKAGMDKERYAVKDARFEDDRTVVVNFDRSYFLPDLGLPRSSIRTLMAVGNRLPARKIPGLPSFRSRCRSARASTSLPRSLPRPKRARFCM